MRKARYVFAILLISSFLMVRVAAQGLPLDVHMSADLPLQSFPIGQTTRVFVNVTNVVESTVQLEFVGLKFDWNTPDRFFVGGASDKGAVLEARQQLTYSINVDVPKNATPGTHKLSAYVSFRWIVNGNWTGIIANTWVADVQLAYPQTQGQTTQTGSGQTINLGSVGFLFLVAAVVILVYSERARIFHRSRKSTKRKPTTSRQSSS